MSEEGSSMPPVGEKSKQERIRDNQRRSRARRQEYLTDLERRLSECHITCREASLQKETFTQLQLENTRLRELLAFAGVSSDLIENYVSQDAVPTGGSESALRHLKPKLSSTSAGSSCGPRGCGRDAASCGRPADAAVMPAPPLGSEMHGTLLGDESFPGYSTVVDVMPDAAPMPAYPSNASDHLSTDLQSTELDWMFQQQVETARPMQTSSSPNVFGDQFPMTSYSPSGSASENVVLCSAARHLIDHHRITPGEIKDIRTWSESHPAQPASPGTESGFDQRGSSREHDALRMQRS